MKTDHPWKDVLEEHPREALEFMFPGTAALIDWSEFPRSLEQEMRKLLPASATGDRIVDRLLGCKKGEGEFYVHLEVQGKPEDVFPNRVVEYNDAATLHLRHPVLSVAILVDDDPDWKPARYAYEESGFRKTVEWPVFKALDWLGRFDELERHRNPFAFFLLCHLRAQATEGKDEEREAEGKH
ncbi:MAG: hypothetical protein K2W96_26625 [Gemmataceae bacterium]|nr:hypothetical protein [Gemmataceae bacterium]